MDGPPRNQLVIKRDMHAPDNTGRGVLCGQNRLEVQATGVAQCMILVASESSKELVNGFEIFGPILRIHDWQGDGVFMGRPPSWPVPIGHKRSQLRCQTRQLNVTLELYDASDRSCI